MKRRSNALLSGLINPEAIVSTALALIAAGVTYGSLNARVNIQESKPDLTPRVTALQEGVNDVKNDMQDLKKDVREIRALLLGRPR